MVKNRSAPPCAVVRSSHIPTSLPPWPWLQAALGLRVRLRIGNHRTQMWFGAACVIVGEQGEKLQWATRSSTLLRVPDVDALCAQAVANGAKLLHPPKTHPYGERQAALTDFAGHIWTLTQSVEDIDPAAWGGEAVEL